MSYSTAEIMNRGMNCLMQHLGVLEEEHFAATVIREKTDYTRWQREYFDGMSPEEVSQAAERFEQNEPYTGKSVRL